MKLTDDDIKAMILEDFDKASEEWRESIALKPPKEKYSVGGITNFITKNDFHIDPEEEEMFILFREDRKEWEKRFLKKKSKKK